MIRRAGTLGAAVHPVGAGGRPSRINDPRGDRPRVFVSTERLDQVLQLDEQSLLVHAQAGLTGLDLERILAPRGLSIGDYPPVVLTSSLGGIIAVRTPGKSSARHGFFEEAVVGVSAVLADGRTVHTRVAPRRVDRPRPRARAVRQRGHDRLHHVRRAAHPSAARVAARRGVHPAVDRCGGLRGAISRCARRPRRAACASTTPPRPRATSTASRCPPAARSSSRRPRARPISPRAIAI